MLEIVGQSMQDRCSTVGRNLGDGRKQCFMTNKVWFEDERLSEHSTLFYSYKPVPLTGELLGNVIKSWINNTFCFLYNLIWHHKDGVDPPKESQFERLPQLAAIAVAFQGRPIWATAPIGSHSGERIRGIARCFCSGPNWPLLPGGEEGKEMKMTGLE